MTHQHREWAALGHAVIEHIYVWLSSWEDFCWLLDDTSVRSSTLAEDDESSGDSEPIDDDEVMHQFICDDEQQNDDDDDIVDAAAADNEQLETDVMQQLGLLSWFSVLQYSQYKSVPELMRQL